MIGFLIERGHDRRGIEDYSPEEIKLFYRWAKIEQRQERAVQDLREMHVLNAALALFSKEGAGVFNRHQTDLAEEIKEQQNANVATDNN